jgi:hypothetical protein
VTAGVLLGGFGGDFMAKRNIRWAVLTPAFGLLFCTPAYILAFQQSTVLGTMLLLGLGGIGSFLYYSPTLALSQNLVGPRMRASASFISIFITTLVGLGLGPALLGFLSDTLAAHAFTLGDFAASCPGGKAPAGSALTLRQACETASATGLRRAMLWSMSIFAWSSLHYFLASRTLKKDLYAAPAVA